MAHRICQIRNPVAIQYNLVSLACVLLCIHPDPDGAGFGHRASGQRQVGEPFGEQGEQAVLKEDKFEDRILRIP